jgi:hypothetical protein
VTSIWALAVGVGVLAVAVVARAAEQRRDVPVSLAVGSTVTLSLGALVHDLVPAHPPIIVSWVLVAAVLLASSATLGTQVAATVRARLGAARALTTMAGMTAATAFAAMAPARLLRAGNGPVEQLAWTLGEEDSAQIVGIAREMMTMGPAGGELAGIYGTGFMVAPVTLMRMLGLAAGEDPRLAAVYAFTLSVAMASIAFGLAMLLLALTTGRSSARTARLSLVTAFLAALFGGVVAQSFVVFLPMRTGFLSLVWSMAWLVLAASLAAIELDHPTRVAQVLLVAHVIAATLLVVRSWPFLLAAALPPLLLVLRPLPWQRAVAGLRSRRSFGVIALLLLAVAAWRFLTSSLFGEVLSSGREALTIGASGIEADRLAIRLVTVAILLAGLAILASGVDRVPRVAIVVGVPGALLLSWSGLKVLALLLTDGELNYAGWKLFYATVSVAAVVGFAALAGSSIPDRSWTPGVAGTILGVVLLTSSGTAGTSREWWDRTAPRTPPHAVAAIDAVRASSIDLPIRCTPQPGTAATEGARWAAYFCVRWMEDAFNEDRFHGHRFTFLGTEEPTFEEAVRRAREQDPSRYSFAYPMNVGPGWFGWDGVS